MSRTTNPLDKNRFYGCPGRRSLNRELLYAVVYPFVGPGLVAIPSDRAKSAHGFVRNRDWKVHQTAHQGSETIVEITCSDCEDTRALWPHVFQLLLRVTVGQQLQVELIVTNNGDASFQYTGALHSYFAIGHIEQISIAGLEGVSYIDKMDEDVLKNQAGEIHFDRETDRIYVGTTSSCIINDAIKNRALCVSKDGSHSTVVWNPWDKKSAGMADFGNDEYPQMVCIEATNAAGDIKVDAGRSASIATTIKLQ